VSPVEQPTLPAAAGAPASAPRPVAAISRERYEELARRVRFLSWLSLGVITAEGAIAITAGILASSIALIGFGLDSVVEGIASLIIVWRFTGRRLFSNAAEDRAQRLVAIQFFLLAPYVAFESVRALIGGEHPDVSWLGIGLSVASLISMPVLGIAKERLADQLGSAATKGEGRQNMLCAYLAGALLVGLLGNALLGAWWLDPVVGLLIAGVAVKEGREAWRGEVGTEHVLAPLALGRRRTQLVGLLGNALLGAWWLDPVVGLLIAGVAVKEGREAWRGEGCCVSSPLDGAGFVEERCEDDCCEEKA